jgi:hypothetical protein
MVFYLSLFHKQRLSICLSGALWKDPKSKMFELKDLREMTSKVPFEHKILGFVHSGNKKCL